ncbi:TonB-dependent receptor [Sedimenticola sp.]|uniref:TonB-dependent receptor n=1 Tax=Sedimenticola sp. TaxID=1940285 RepID=UPI003D0B69CA
MNKFSRLISAVMIFAALIALSIPIFAKEQTTANEKDEDEAQFEVIVITGMRKSLETSAQIKKNTLEIVDSITAEDIGKLPDLNVAETLTRVPGVQGYRYGGEGASPVGEGSGLTIRGLSGQTASRVNGRAYFTAGGREFNIEGAIPGMIAGIDVYKNPSAEHIEGGIGGLINLRTRKPFDFEKRIFNTALSWHYNDLAEAEKPEVFSLYTNRWLVGENEIGVMLAANYQESHKRSDSDPIFGRGPQLRRAVRADSAEYATLAGANQLYAGRSDIWHLTDVSCPDGSSYTDDPTCLSLAQRDDLITTLGQEKHIFQEDIRRVRKGANAALQWRLNDTLDLYVEGNYNYYLYDQNYRFAIFSDSRTVRNLTTADYTFDEEFMNRNLNGDANERVAGQRLTGGTFLNSSVRMDGGHEDRPFETWLISVGTNWQPTEKLDVHFDLSTIDARQTRDNRSVGVVARSGLGWELTRVLTSTPHDLAIIGPDLSDPSNFVFSDYNNNGNEEWHDNGWATQIDLKYLLDLPLLEQIKFGGRYAVQKSRYSDSSFVGRHLTSDGQPLAADQSNAVLFSALQGFTDTSPTNWLDGDAGYSGGYVVYDPDKLGGNHVRDLFPLAGIPDDDAIAENLPSRRFAREQTYAAYAVAEFSYGDTIRGNLGVRVIKTDLHTRAMIMNQDGDIVPNPDDTSYVDVLPSFNVIRYLDEVGDTLVRFGYSNGITRATMADLNPTIDVNTLDGTGSRGNPDLRPLKSHSFDLSLEKYFSGLNYASAVLFYKDIDGFFNNLSRCERLPAFPVYLGPDNGCPENQYLITRRVNAEKGSVKGVELAFQTFFDYDMMPYALRNFGVSASYSYLKTEQPVNFFGTIVDAPIPFQSKNNWTLSGLYEDDFLSVRVVYTYRSDFVLFFVDPWPSLARYVKGYGILDASANVNVTDNVVLSLNVANLTDEAPHRYSGEPGRYASNFQVQHFVNGRNFSIGLRYTF